MKNYKSFITKDDVKIRLSSDDLDEIVPDADMRYSVVILKDGSKHFVSGTEEQIRKALNS